MHVLKSGMTSCNWLTSTSSEVSLPILVIKYLAKKENRQKAFILEMQNKKIKSRKILLYLTSNALKLRC